MYSSYIYIYFSSRDCRGRDRMVVIFTFTSVLGTVVVVIVWFFRGFRSPDRVVV